MKSLIVTGFVPDAFPARHLSQDQFRALGERLRAALGGKLRAFETPFRDCWAARDILRDDYGNERADLLPSCANPPADRFATPQDMVRSNVVLLQRFAWLWSAFIERQDTEVLAWVEFSALKQSGVTEAVLQRFAVDLERLPPFHGVCAPGCWPLSPIDDSEAHWRFVGSCFVVHRDYTRRLYDAVRGVATTRARVTNRISWDMNTLAFVELLNAIPFRWYRANHDETQFVNYAGAVLSNAGLSEDTIPKAASMPNWFRGVTGAAP